MKLSKLLLGLLAGLVFATLGMLWPYHYTANGQIAISRKVDPISKEYYSYDGYYAEQVAVSYTGSFIAVLSSKENLEEALIKSTIDQKGINKSVLKRLVRIKKDGPRVISLQVSATTKEDAINLWNLIADSAINTHKDLIKNSDSMVNVEKIDSSPSVESLELSPISLFIFGGALFMLISVVHSWIINYLKEEK